MRWRRGIAATILCQGGIASFISARGCTVSSFGFTALGFGLACGGCGSRGEGRPILR